MPTGPIFAKPTRQDRPRPLTDDERAVFIAKNGGHADADLLATLATAGPARRSESTRAPQIRRGNNGWTR